MIMTISIIIPIYNTSKYLRECLDSLTPQLVDDIEILLIDDCSTDNSVEIAKEYVEKDNRIRLFVQPQNAGVSSARNRGILGSRGDFICFIDSDDFVEKNYVQRLLELTKTNYDLISFGMKGYCHNGDEHYSIKESSMNCSVSADNPTESDYRNLFIKSFFAAPWNKLYKKSFLNGLLFNENCVSFEDFLFNLEYCKYVKNFIIIDDALYYYRQDLSRTSASKRKWGKTFDLSNLAGQKIQEFINERKDYNFEYLKHFTYTCFIDELTFVYFYKKAEFNSKIKELSKNKYFLSSLKSFKPSGKTLMILRLSFFFHCRLLQKKVLTKIISKHH